MLHIYLLISSGDNLITGVAPHGTLAERSCRCEESATRQPRPRLLRLRLAMTVRVARRQDPLLALSGWRSGAHPPGVPPDRSSRRSATRPRRIWINRTGPARPAR